MIDGFSVIDFINKLFYIIEMHLHFAYSVYT